MTSKSAAMRLTFMEMLLNAEDGQVFVMIKDGQPIKITVSHDTNATQINGLWIDEMVHQPEWPTKILILGTHFTTMKDVVDKLMRERGFSRNMFIMIGIEEMKCKGLRKQSFINTCRIDKHTPGPVIDRYSRILLEMRIGEHQEYDRNLNIVKNHD